MTTKAERAILEIQKGIDKVLCLTDTHERLKVDVAKLTKVVFDNGLNSQVKELHEDMKERKIREAQTEMEKTKSNLNLRNLLIGIMATLVVNIVLELLLHK